MATFTLPKNSKITGKGKVHKAEGATNVKSFKVYRYDPDSVRIRVTILSRSISTNVARWCSTLF